MIHWSPDPILFSAGPVKVRWYGLMFVIGFAVGQRLVAWMCRKENKPVEHLDTLLFYIVAGTIVGARLGHCLFYEPLYFLNHPLEIFAVWQGGLASHGGGLGVLIAVWLFSRRYKDYPLLWIIDRAAPAVAFTGALIRIGNLFNSEILGRPSDVPWAFVFERVDLIPRHPAQLYESLSYLLVSLVGYGLYRRFRYHPPRGLLFGVTLAGIFTARIIWEFFKENQEPFEAGMLMNMGQLLSLPFVAAGIYFVYRALRARPKNS